MKPVNKLPKVVLSPKEGNLYRTNSNKYIGSAPPSISVRAVPSMRIFVMTTQITLQKPIDGLATPTANASRGMDISYYGTKSASNV